MLAKGFYKGELDNITNSVSLRERIEGLEKKKDFPLANQLR
jgi:hypothetical protein